MIDRVREHISKGKLLVLNIIIIVLAIIIVGLLWNVGQETVYCLENYVYKPDSFLYAMEAENYEHMMYMYYNNVMNGYEDKKELQESHGVAKYIEAAFYYKVFTEAGDSSRAEKQKAAMEEAELQMGDFSFLTDTFNQRLGITE